MGFAPYKSHDLSYVPLIATVANPYSVVELCYEINFCEQGRM